MSSGPIWNDKTYVDLSDVEDRQSPSCIAIAPNGDYIVVWVENGVIKGKFFSFDGEALSNDFQIGVGTNLQNAPTVSVLSDGRFSVAWEEVASGAREIRARVFGPNGPGNFDPAVTVGLSQVSNPGIPKVVPLANGSYMVVWTGNGPGLEADIKFKTYDAGGNEIGSEFRLNTTAGNIDTDPKVTVRSDGLAIVSWISSVTSQSGTVFYNLKYCEVSPSGTPLGTEKTLPVGTFTSPPKDFNIEILTSWNFVVTWLQNDGSGDVLKGQLFDRNGTKIGLEFNINATNTAGHPERTPVIKALANGEFVVVWVDDGPNDADIIRAQIFNANGGPKGSEFVVQNLAGGAIAPSVIVHNDSRFTITWTDQAGS
jgi:hypothetical protein